MGIYEDFQQGIGMFSPITPFSAQRKLAQAVAPALGHTLGADITSARRLTGDIATESIRGNAGLKMSNIKDVGETFRQKLINDAQLTITGMRESGALSRNKYSADMGFAGQKYGADSHLTGLTYGQDETSRRQKKKLDFDSSILDDMKIDAWRRGGVSGGNPASIIDKLDRGYGAGSAVQRSGGGGGGFADQLLEEDEGFTY